MKRKLKFAKKKPITVSKMKKKVWEVFSRYIRTRYALKNGIAQCVTCKTMYPWKQLHAGHFLPGRHNSVLFDERNCHTQCYHCNVGLKSNPIKYFRYMQETYGEDTIEELERLDRKVKEFKVYELEELLEKFKTKLKSLSDPGEV